jgi:hypothetical protein
VLEAKIPNRKTVRSPNKFTVQLRQYKEVPKFFSESEVLVRGKVTGAKVQKVSDN